MQLLSLKQAITRRRFLRFNILLGILTFVVAFYLIATTDFASYAELKAREAIYNRIAIGGLIYAAVMWIFCAMSKPFWFPFKKSQEK
ncbi:MAG: hypothetical protein OEZ39_02755 [Gammaproteobacteria bacterium]|nr:hypothetical protein [Gammaproteobacteria bacterium]MDH5650776.1 hypothetical protein [Gammaproteobacteria bacterium]